VVQGGERLDSRTGGVGSSVQRDGEPPAVGIRGEGRRHVDAAEERGAAAGPSISAPADPSRDPQAATAARCSGARPNTGSLRAIAIACASTLSCGRPCRRIRNLSLPPAGDALVRRCRRTEAGPLADLSDSQPAELSDSGQALTRSERANSRAIVVCQQREAAEDDQHWFRPDSPGGQGVT